MSAKQPSSSPVRVAAVQMNSSGDLSANLGVAHELLGEAASAGCKLAVLPENFPIIGRRKEAKLECAEELGSGPIQDFLARTARENDLWIVSGSIPLKAEVADRCYGATLVVDDEGKTRSCYRKIHLFDVSLPDREQSYRESASLTPGGELVVQESPAGCLGLSICYDLRFPEMYRGLVDMGATVLSIPSAFTAATGAAHWHALLRARAIENLAYVIAPGQYGRHADGRTTYGHSLIIDPWGRIVAEVPEGDCILTADLDPELPQRLRDQFPSLDHRVFR